MALADVIVEKIRAEARRQGLLDPDLAVAVAMKESALKPWAWGDRGKSLGLFQLQRAAAIDAGIDPNRRQEVDLNIAGGVRFWNQKLAQSQGNVAEALRRYNSGTPTFKGLGDPRYVERTLAIRRDLDTPAAFAKYGAAETSPLTSVAGRAVRALSRWGRPGRAEAADAQPGALSDEALMGQLGLAPRVAPEPAPAPPAAAEPPALDDEALMQQLGLTPSPRLGAAETFPPLAEQEAASTHKALYGRLPSGYDPATGPPSLAGTGLSTTPAAPAASPAPAQPFSFGRQTFAGTAEEARAAQEQQLGSQAAGRLQAERDVGSLTVPAPSPTQLGKTAAATGVSLAGSMGGAALGTVIGGALGGVGAPVGTVAGEMAGSYAARKVNIALGLEEPGLGGDIAAVALPGLGRLAGPATRAVVRRLPGAQGVLHTELGERLAGQAERLLPATPSAALYEQVAQGTNPRLATRTLWRTAREIIRDEMRLQPAMRNRRLLRVAQDLVDLSQPGVGQVPLDQLYAHQQRVGQMIRTAGRTAGSEERGLRRLYGAFHDDLEAAAQAGIPEAATLRTAIAASRREHAVDELQELFTPGRPGIVQRADGQLSISGGRLQTRFEDRLRHDPVFRESFQQEELQEIRGLLQEATRLKALTAPRGVAFGSGPSLGRGALATAVTAAITQDPALAAMMGTLATGAPHVLAWGLMTAPGRAIVRQAIRQGHRLEDRVTLLSLVMAMRPAAAPVMPPGE